ncbi:MAG: DMT family transporter [Desulfobacteraceae bacterium]|nr:MAG: DMT family transporter [Desulfobacteraceae bacterium]
MNQRRLGIVYVLISAASFGAMAIFANLAYTAGATPITVLFLRFSLAGLIMLAYIRIKKIAIPRGRLLLITILMGAVGYAGQSFSFFTALLYASSGTVAILLYLHPALVALFAVFAGHRITLPEVIALILALLGTVCVIGFEMQGEPLGIILGLMAALIYSLYIMTGTRVMSQADVRASSTVIMLSAAMVYTLAVGIKGIDLPATPAGWAGIFGIVVFSTVVAIVTFFEGLTRIGPVHATMLSTLEPVVTVILAWVFFKEGLTVLQYLGGGMILAAGVLLARKPAA